jgi:hypothetical protein
MSAEPSIVIASAARTPVGSFNGAYASLPAHELGAIVIKEVLARAGVDAADVDEVILGQVLTAGQGQNPARQAAVAAGIPVEASAWGLNQVCGSGLRTIAIGLQQIANGDAKIIVAGGQESMSLSQHGQHLRAGAKMGDLKLVDTMIKDGCGTRSTAITWATPPRTWRASSRSPARRRTSLRCRFAEQGRSSPEGRQIQGRNRRRHHQGQEGRHGRRRRRIYPSRRDH